MAFSTYEKLNSQHSEIRRLKPGIGEDGGVQCELTKHTLTAKLEHRALSYAWGDPKVTKRITVNGQSFHATTNLVAALEILAHEQLPAYSIWVDAICINQNDIQERTAQVQLMGEIFKNAKACFSMARARGGPQYQGYRAHEAHRGKDKIFSQGRRHFPIDASSAVPL
jgi:hypothetical protein